MFTWLEHFAHWLIFSVFALSEEGRLGAALEFFVYDVVKILILLFLIIFLMGIVNAYLPIEKLRDFLHRRKLYGFEYLFASLFGAITPFCSCSSVPLFIGFVQGGIPLGVTFAFLITSPLVNEVALAMFVGYFGLKTTLIYAGTGILLGTVGGWILGKMKLEAELSEWMKKILAMKQAQGNAELEDEQKPSFRERLPGISREAWEIVRSVLLYIIIGIAVGAFLYGYVPEEFFSEYLGGGEWWTVPFAVLFAVPMYANAAAIVPVIQVFVSKGVALGTAIAFMMATVGLSIPEATLIKKVMSVKLIAIYFTLVTVFIILSGFFFNLVL